MARNYAKEANWAAGKYTRLSAQLDKDLVEQFKAKLKAKNLTYAGWLRNRIENLMEAD